MTSPARPDGGEGDPREELRRVAALLLKTQQQLIDLRAVRDRERQVLGGILSLGARVRDARDRAGFWALVAEASTAAFNCELSLVVERRGDVLTLVGHAGPHPTSPAERAALDHALLSTPSGHHVPAAGDAPLRFGGRPVAAMLHAPIGDASPAGGWMLVLGSTEHKRAFFEPLGAEKLPGLRIFASHIGVIHQMHRSRERIADQVRLLDRTNGELQRRIREERRAAEEREQLRSELAHARRLESIGRLAGGVAHDFNNLIAVVNGNAELLQMEADLKEDGRLALAGIIEAGARAASLTRQLLTYGRRQVIRPREADLNELIDAALRLYAPVIGDDIRLDFRPCPGGALVMADPDQFGQLLSNLLLNARDAIREAAQDGRPALIRVQTTLVPGTPGERGARPAVRMEVADTGTGMDDATRQRAFEPFFTTKAVGSGTGLGLAAVAGMVEQNGGTIEIDTALGVGTTFRLTWPLLEARAGDATPPRGASGERPVVMLVDDEARVRDFTRRGLEKHGFSVFAFDGGPAALASLEVEGRVPDVLITDVRMPMQTGPELAAAMQRRLPDLPVVYISGYTADLVSRDGVVPEDIELVEKPFSVKELSARVYRLLARQRRQQASTGHGG